MSSRVAALVLAAALVGVLGWPAAATVLAAWRGTADETGGGLMAPSPDDLAAGRVARPLALARTSIALVVLTEAIALPVGLPLALVLFRTDAWGRRALIWLLAASALVPMPLHATGWIGGFGNLGRAQAIGSAPWLVGLPGAAFIHAMAALPWVVLLAGVGMRAVEAELEESALLDLPAWRVLAGVTVRRSLPATAAAALAVAALTAGDMTVTDLLQVRSYAEEAYVQFQIGQGPAAASAVTLPPLFVLGGLLLLASRGILRVDPARLAPASDRAKLWRLGAWRVPLGLLVAVVVGGLVLVPPATLVWRAGRVGGAAALGQAPRWSASGLLGTLHLAALDVAGPLVDGPLREALLTGSPGALRRAGRWFGDPMASPLVASLAWSALAATGATALAWALAWAGRRSRAWRLAGASSVALVLATPGPVAGMALVLAYRSFPSIYDTPANLVLAMVLRTFPFALLVVWPKVRGIPVEWLEAAAVDGWRPAGQAWRVALPVSRGAVAAAWCVAFVLALGELPATNLVASPGARTIAIEIWTLLHTGVESHLAGVALVMLGVVAIPAALAAAVLARADPFSVRAP